MRKVIGFDTETILERGAYQFLSAQFWSKEFGFRDFVTDPQQVPEYFKHRTRGSVFLAQNAEYDFSVLWKVLKDQGYTFKFLFNKGRFIYGKLVKKDHAWNIYDLRNIFVNWSLKKIGEFIGCKKLDSPPNLGLQKPKTSKEWQYFKKYALRDAEICYRAGKWIQKRIGSVRVSAPSLSFSEYNKHFKPFGIYLNVDDSINQKLRLAYKGGRAECFIRGSPDQIVYVYDVVSLYPYIMRECKMPLGIGDVKQKTSVDLSHEGIAWCLVQQDTEIPILGTKLFTKDGNYKLIFPNGKFASYFTYPELRYLEWKNLGKILHIYQAWEVERSDHIFRDFVEHYFKKKQTDVKGADFWKLFLNSLYGKFAQEADSPEMVLNPNGELQESQSFIKRKPLIKTNIMIAAYITAKARIYMHNLYQQTGTKNLVYTDTDSIHTLKPFNEKPNGLGTLSFKGKTDAPKRATYVRTKFYIFNDVLKCKGLQYILKANEMRRLVEIGDVTVLTKMLLRVRSAFRWHRELLSETSMMKHFTLSDDGKRIYEKVLSGKSLLDYYAISKPLMLRVDNHGLE